MCPAFPKDTQFQANYCPTSSDAASLLCEKNIESNKQDETKTCFKKKI